jgi:hypothetical protein
VRIRKSRPARVTEFARLRPDYIRIFSAPGFVKRLTVPRAAKAKDGIAVRSNGHRAVKAGPIPQGAPKARRIPGPAGLSFT